MTRTLSLSPTTPVKSSRSYRSPPEKVGNPKRIGKATEAVASDCFICQSSSRSMRSRLFISLFLSLHSAFATTGTFKIRPIDVWRPRDYTAVNNIRTASETQGKCYGLEWDRLIVPAPDVTDHYTLAQLGRMAANAYALPGAPNWWDLDPMWTSVGVALPRIVSNSHFGL